jgi:cytochrome c biogenesis protein CcmG, thiol:disulfide interchange protein DsbE
LQSRTIEYVQTAGSSDKNLPTVSSAPASALSIPNRSDPRAARLLTVGVTLVVVALLALFVWGMGRRGATVGSVQTPLREAPAFQLALFNQGAFSLDQASGRPVVLNFWASWCIPCEDEAPVLQSASTRYSNRIQFVGVDVQDTDTEAQRFLRRFGVTYPNGRDASGAISIDYGMSGVPETYFIRPDGRIQRKWAGPLAAAQLESFLTELLAL